LDEDGIDRSLWLPKDEPILNEFRLAKIDIAIDRLCDSCEGLGAINGSRCTLCKGRGRLTTAWRGHELDPLSDIRFAQAKVRNILAFLHQSNIINDQHAHDGRTYEIWYEIFKAGSTMEKKPLYGALRGELAREGLSEYGFLLLLQAMPNAYHLQIKRAIYTIQTEHHRWLARRQGNSYLTVFEKLTEQIPLIREKLKELSEKE
jgi:hypothetical protein